MKSRVMWVVMEVFVILGAGGRGAAAEPGGVVEATPSAFEPRTLDFAAGVLVGEGMGHGAGVTPGLALDARVFPSRVLWFGAAGGATFTQDGDPERGIVNTLGFLGLSAGARASFASSVEGYAGLQVDGLRTTGLVDDRRDQWGVRGGPQLGIALAVGQLWGHPCSFEARASYLLASFEHGPQTVATWHGGLYFRAVLLPDRPLR